MGYAGIDIDILFWEFKSLTQNNNISDNTKENFAENFENAKHIFLERVEDIINQNKEGVKKELFGEEEY